MDDKLTTSLVLVLQIILGIESILAFLGNGFIITVNGHRWLQSRKMLPSDLILTALGTTRFLLQLFIVIFQLQYTYPLEFVCDSYLWNQLFSAWAYFSSVSVWCATLLSVFYCVKITNFAHTVFLWLKPRIDRLVPRLLGLSLIISLIFFATQEKIRDYCRPTGNITGNVSQGEEIKNYRDLIFIYLYFTFTAINVSICLTASILLFISLWRHTRNLKRSGFATKDLNTQAHISVVYSLLSFLFFYVVYIVALITALVYSIRSKIVVEYAFDVALSLCPSAHSIVLILTNPKLKDVCIKILKIRQRNPKRKEERSRHVSIVP